MVGWLIKVGWLVGWLLTNEWLVIKVGFIYLRGPISLEMLIIFFLGGIANK